MVKLKKHIFICTNERPPGAPRGCCSSKGSMDLIPLFKEELKKQGLDAVVRAQKSGCLDVCEWGSSVVVYPEGVWYGRVTKEDVREIVENHIKGDRPVERLRIPGK